jgi:phage FluMu protein Com
MALFIFKTPRSSRSSFDNELFLLKMFLLKEYRCEYCNKLLFKGNLKDCLVEIKCKNCKKINKIKAVKACLSKKLSLAGQNNCDRA